VGVYPPSGRVRVAAPLRINDEAVKLAVISRLSWIRRQRNHFVSQERQSQREFVTGESHYFQGRRYRLSVIERAGPALVHLANSRTIQLFIPPGAHADTREATIQQWYRRSLQKRIPQLLAKWEAKLGVSNSEVRIRRMKTRWGSCNDNEGRIWLNLELAKKPPACLEYILVHEMVHLSERHHNERFRRLMDLHMPNWRVYRDQLNRAPLAHETSKY
jgi:predicted metal-dependent hydrolase